MHARGLVLAGLLAAGCAAAKPPPPLALPVAMPGAVEVAARGTEPAGDVTVVEVSLSSEHPSALALDRKQVYVRKRGPAGAPPQRVAPLSSAEAARRAGGAGLPDAARSSVYGAAEGGLRGAATGAVTGGGSGGMVGAAVGAIGGVFRGAQDQPPDVAGFEDRALASTVLRPGVSATGLAYFPLGDYDELEVVLIGDAEVIRLVVLIAPPPQPES